MQSFAITVFYANVLLFALPLVTNCMMSVQKNDAESNSDRSISIVLRTGALYLQREVQLILETVFFFFFLIRLIMVMNK